MSRPNGPHCNGCPLHTRGTGFMRVDGKGTSGVMLVGEALGADEAAKGLPFVGAAGHMLRKILKRFVKRDRSEFWIANTIWCRPPRNDLAGAWYERQALEHCHPHLADAIHERQPKAIVALGGIPTRELTGQHSVEKAQNYAFWSAEFNCWVVPVLHPSYIMRGNSRFMPVAGHGILKALRIAEEGYSFEKIKTIHEPNGADLDKWVGRYLDALAKDDTIPLAFDIETNYKGARDESDLKEGDDPTYDITQISFAFDEDEGISMAWDQANFPYIREVLGTHYTKIVWNRSYDVPRIRHNNVAINGTIRDSMGAWHVLQSDLPKGLGFVTPLIPANHRIPHWKGASDQEGGWWYSAMDSTMLWRNDHHIIKMLKSQGIYEFYHDFVEEVRPVLDDMEAAGVLVDKEAHEDFCQKTGQELARLEEEMQKHVPTELRNVHPKEGYKRDPAELEGVSDEVAAQEGYTQVTIPNQTWKRCPVCLLKNPTKAHFKEYRAKAHLHKNTMCSGEVAEEVKGDERRWAKVLPFKPSPAQLIRYAEWKGYALRKNYKTGNLTMDEETLEKMLKKHPNDPLFPLVLQHRGVQKEYGLYGPEGMLIGDDGRVHTHFSDNPSTLRFASYDPNMQNIPRDSAIRGLFIAAPGHILGARDFTGIEAVIVGYLADDRDYTRLAKMGVHDYVNAHIAVERGLMPVSDLPDLTWDDDTLREYLGELKVKLKKTRPIAKAVVHMSNYLGTPIRMYQAAPGLYENVAAAARVQDMYFEVFPSIPKWQRQTCLLAEKQSYIRSPYGLPQRFQQPYIYELDSETREWVKVLGPDAKRCVAANPQHMAAAVMRRSLRDLKDSPIRQWLRLTIHDELMWECPKAQLGVVDEEIQAVMEAPNKHLKLNPAWGMGEYLSFGTEGKYGYRWKEMK